MPHRPAILLAIPGIAAVAIGAYIPWIRPNPQRSNGEDHVPSILLPEMHAGIAEYSLLLLVLLATVVLFLELQPATRLHALIVGVAGLVCGTVPLYYLAVTSLVGFDATFVPAYGWYLSLGGGLLLSGAGAFHFLTTEFTA